MRKRLSLKGGITLLAVLGLIAIGVAYAVEISRPITGSVIIGQVETAEETILLYTQVDPTVVELTELMFDPVDISAFGRFKSPARIPFLAQNGGDAPFHLRVELMDVKLNGAPLPDDALSMLMGRGGEELLPSPEHAILIQPEELLELDAGLLFQKSPGELGIDSGDVITFTALFIAAEGPVVEPPRPRPVTDPIELAKQYGETPRYGGKFLNAVIETVPHHDYSQGVGSNYQTQTQLLNTLLMSNPYDWTQIMPDLAHSWEVSADGRKYTFYLHEGVKWHDGAPFSSADVKYTFDRIIAKGKILGNETAGTFNNRMWVAIIDSIETPDANTVVINLRGSTPTLLAILSDAASSIIPKHISEKDPLNALKEHLKPIGTGPFRLTEEPTTLLWRYERNPDYFKPALPFLDEMESHVILDIETRATAVVTERVHWSDPTPLPQIPFSLAERLGKEPGVVHEGIPSLLFNHFIVNTQKAPFDDIRVRQAFSEALDRPQFLLDGLGNQRGVIGTALFPNGKWAMPIEMRNELIGYGPDMAKRSANAKRLLAEYEADNGPIDWDNDVHYQCATNHISCENAQIAQALIKKNLGVVLTLDTMEIMRLVGLFFDGGFNQSGIIGLNEFDDPTSAFGKSYVTGSRYGSWARNSNAEIDALYEKQLFIADEDERKKIVWEMDAIAMNDASLNILLWTVTEHLRRDFIKGWVSFPSVQNTSVRMEHVWLDIPGTRTTK